MREGLGDVPAILADLRAVQQRAMALPPLMGEASRIGAAIWDLERWAAGEPAALSRDTLGGLTVALAVLRISRSATPPGSPSAWGEAVSADSAMHRRLQGHVEALRRQLWPPAE